MLNFEDIFDFFFCRKLIHKASQLRLFELNQSKISSVVGLQSWTTTKTAQNVYLGVPGLNEMKPKCLKCWTPSHLFITQLEIPHFQIYFQGEKIMFFNFSLREM